MVPDADWQHFDLKVPISNLRFLALVIAGITRWWLTDYTDAIRLLERAVANMQSGTVFDTPATYYYLGNAYSKIHSPAQALKYYDLVLAFTGMSPISHHISTAERATLLVGKRGGQTTQWRSFRPAVKTLLSLESNGEVAIS